MTIRLRSQRLSASLVLGGAALVLACDHGAAQGSARPGDASDAPSTPVTPSPPGASSTSQTDSTPPLPTSETEAVALANPTTEDACECAGSGVADCTANGVMCCWAADPCCEPCC